MTGAFDPPAGAVREAASRALDEDFGVLGDLTSIALVPEGARAVGRLVARCDGVLAGTRVAAEVYRRLDPSTAIDWTAGDGATLTPGCEFGRVDGDLRSILAGERTALNFLCHLSGVATATRRFVVAAGEQVRVLDTRKTLPGLRALEKAAVRAGGGHNHRGSLSDAILVKDNHLVGLGIDDAVGTARRQWPGRTVEIECDRTEQVVEAVQAGADIVMVDNMSPEQVAECVALVRASRHPDTLVEVSGGVTLDTVAAYAAAGPDVISTSAITQSAAALDLGLDVEAKG